MSASMSAIEREWHAWGACMSAKWHAWELTCKSFRKPMSALRAMSANGRGVCGTHAHRRRGRRWSIRLCDYLLGIFGGFQPLLFRGRQEDGIQPGDGLAYLFCGYSCIPF